MKSKLDEIFVYDFHMKGDCINCWLQFPNTQSIYMFSSPSKSKAKIKAREYIDSIREFIIDYIDNHSPQIIADWLEENGELSAANKLRNKFKND